MAGLAIGIDLGTTNSCAAVYTKGRVKVLENKEGDRITPSYVFFTDQDAAIVGKYARRMTDTKPEYGVFEIKRLIGRNYDDPFVSRNLKYLPYTVKDIDNKPLVIVESKNKIIKKTPQELCAYILGTIKKDVEDKLGVKVAKAVVTVPAYFSVEQREATLEACQQVGLKVMKLFSEPTAAALAYYFENHKEETNHSIVFDLGGGTFDVAILHRNNEKIYILAVDGDTRLGGHDFDNLLVDYVSAHLQRNHNINLGTDRRTMRRLRNECEEAKKCLSAMESTTINLVGIVPNKAIEVPITRAEFENLIGDLCEKTIQIMDRCISASSITKSNMTEVILSGGSTRIPFVQRLVSQYFGGKKLNKFVSPDECVAEGAALQAAMLSSHPEQKLSDVKIRDVTPLSISIKDFVGSSEIVIERNTPIPTTVTISKASVYDKQTEMKFEIYEGERVDSSKNHFLGRLDLNDLSPAPPGNLMASVRMNLDNNGILRISAREILSGKSNDLKIAYTHGHRSETEVQSTVVSAALAKEEDERFLDFADAKADLIQYCVDIMYQLDSRNLRRFHESEYSALSEIFKDAESLEVHEMKTARKLKKAAVKLCAPLVSQHMLYTW